MNDNQFDALLDKISEMNESIDTLSLAMASLAATIAKVGDPKGWEKATKKFDSLSDDDMDGDNAGQA